MNSEEEVSSLSDPRAGFPDQLNSFSITESMLLSLRQTRPWARVFSIFGLLSACFLAIIGLMSIIALFNLDPKDPTLPMVLTGSVCYPLLGLLFFIPSLFLFKFASSIEGFLDGGGVAELEKIFLNQKFFWKFIGILTIISFVFVVIGIAAAIIIPQFAADSRI